MILFLPGCAGTPPGLPWFVFLIRAHLLISVADRLTPARLPSQIVTPEQVPADVLASYFKPKRPKERIVRFLPDAD